MSVSILPGQGERAHDEQHTHPHGWRRWLYASNHKEIGTLQLWSRIAMPDRKRSLIALESRDVKVEIGAFVGQEMRRQVAQALRRELRSRALVR